jgi:hypothetical protein
MYTRGEGAGRPWVPWQGAEDEKKRRAGTIAVEKVMSLLLFLLLLLLLLIREAQRRPSTSVLIRPAQGPSKGWWRRKVG